MNGKLIYFFPIEYLINSYKELFSLFLTRTKVILIYQTAYTTIKHPRQFPYSTHLTLQLLVFERRISFFQPVVQ